MRQWFPSLDMNYDGVFTISDVGLWFPWLFFFPGDLIVLVFINIIPPLGRFFEMNVESYGGIFSAIVSVLFWFMLIFGSILEYKE